MVLHFPPTISMHMTKEVTMVPPLKTAKRNLARTKDQYHGRKDAIRPNIDWRKMHAMSVGFLPTRSAKTPKNMLPSDHEKEALGEGICE